MKNDAPSAPLVGMFVRGGNIKGRQGEENFHVAPARSGLGNTQLHGTSAITSQVYNLKERDKRRPIMTEIGTRKFDVEFHIKYKPIEEIGGLGDFAAELKKIRTKERHILPENMPVLQERLQMIGDRYKIPRVI